jgi:mannosyltransferase
MDTSLERFFPTERTRRPATLAAIGLLMLLAGGLSYFYFMGQSLRLDEAQSLWQSSRTPLAILRVVAGDVHVPLYHELLHFWRLFVGDSVAAARTLSLIFYLLSIPALYLLGKTAYNRSVGLWAALLFTISPFMNWYGNEIRMYTLFAFLVILNQYFYIQILRGKRRDTWFGYALTAVLGVFAHYFFFLNLAAQAIFYFLRRPLFPEGSLRRFITTAVIVVGSFLPWVAYVFIVGEAGNQTPHLATPSTVDLFSVVQQLILGFHNDHINTLFLSIWPLALLFGFFALGRHKRIAPETEYFMLAVAVPIAIAFIASFLLAPIFISRYLVLTVPALYLFIISLFNSFSFRMARISRASLVALMLLMLVLEIGSPSTPVKEDYRLASEYLTAHTSAEDAVVISAPFTVYPIEYYYHGAARVSTIPVWNQYAYGPIPPFHSDTLPQEIASSTVDSQKVWLLLSYDQGYQKEVQTYFDTHYERLYEQTFSPRLTLYVYKLRYDTPLSKTAVTFK